MKDDTAYLRHILDAIELIRQFVPADPERVLVAKPDELVRAGVVRQLEIIGEAVKLCSKATLAQEPDIPWADIAGTRDKLIHEYFGVDYEQVALIVEEDLDGLEQAVRRLLDTRS